MAEFNFEELVGGISGGFGVGVFTSVISAATAGATVTIQAAMTNPITGFFVAIGFGLGFAGAYHKFKKNLVKEQSDEEKADKADKESK